MKLSEAIIQVIKREHLSARTGEAYVHWTLAYAMTNDPTQP